MRPAITLTTAGLVMVLLGAASPASSTPRFETDAGPIFERYCESCHGESMRMGELDLRTREGMLRGGTRGPALIPGSAGLSLLYRRVVDQSMPMGDKKLSAAETDVLRDWIDAGAKMERDAASEQGIDSRAAAHWAFRPLKPPAVPAASDKGWGRNAVDAFIARRLEQEGIEPAGEADPRTLLRRLYFNLIGLPPSPEEAAAFASDPSEKAYRAAVEDLLSRPQYGERWGRRWLDVVRYAESNGYERDATKPYAWRYRDWVIDAFHRDLPFDRFVTAQIAGDEIPDSDAESQFAATFLRLGSWDDEPADPAVDRWDQIDDVLGSTATAFLGLSIRCARCHDHKFEPFTQRDYYSLAAVFAPLKRPQIGRKELTRPAGAALELAAYRAAMNRIDEKIEPLARDIGAIKRRVLQRILEKRTVADLSWRHHAETVLAFTVDPSKRNSRERRLVTLFNRRLEEEVCDEATLGEQAEIEGLEREIAQWNAARPAEPPHAYVWYEDGPEAPPTHVLHRGDVSAPGEVVPPGIPAVLGSAAYPDPVPRRDSSGRRLALARWMTHRQNPLLARVMVNRIWQWHFGEGLSASENDFGVMGQRPTHPALLDYLAAELLGSGGSIKHVQRLIVHSAVFRLSAEWNEPMRKDPDNRWLSRWKPRRLDSEAIRDAMLSVSGALNRKRGGPSIYPKLPQTVLEGQSRPGDGWGSSTEEEASRRSVYIFIKRSLAVPELDMLDFPDSAESCEQRRVSTTGPQALTFLNGEFAVKSARGLARRVVRESGADDAAQVTRAFELVYGRPPRAEEKREALDFLSAQRDEPEMDSRPAIEALTPVLLNSNEFFYLY